jgi:GTPase SAR1 family protein
LRALAYAGKNVFIVAYSVTDYASYWSVFDRWVPELRARTPVEQQHIPIILAAFKGDLCDDMEDYQRDERTIRAREALARGEPRQYRYQFEEDDKKSDTITTTRSKDGDASTTTTAAERRRRVYGPADGSARIWPDALHVGPVSYDEGVAMAHAIGAEGFVEISSLTQFGLRQLFEMSIRIGLQHYDQANGKGGKKNKNCAVQ